MSHHNMNNREDTKQTRRDKLKEIPCRDGTDCYRHNCPYWHPDYHDWSAAAHRYNMPIPACKRGDQCTQRDCRFQHSNTWTHDWKERAKECRYDSRCKNTHCIYRHTERDAERKREEEGVASGELRICTDCKKAKNAVTAFRKSERSSFANLYLNRTEYDYESLPTCSQCYYGTKKGFSGRPTSSASGRSSGLPGPHSHGATSWGYRGAALSHMAACGYEI